MEFRRVQELYTHHKKLLFYGSIVLCSCCTVTSELTFPYHIYPEVALFSKPMIWLQIMKFPQAPLTTRVEHPPLIKFVGCVSCTLVECIHGSRAVCICCTAVTTEHTGS